MINFQTFILGMLVSSTLTGLATEGVKTVLTEKNKTYYANTLAGIVSLVVSALLGVGYVLLMGISFTTQIVVCLIALVLMSWLCAMVGYDKVIQSISQFKTNQEG